jgi:hypothetical protein
MMSEKAAIQNAMAEVTTTNLHGQSLENSFVLNSFDVINSQTNEQVHDDDVHEDNEEDEEKNGNTRVVELSAMQAIGVILQAISSEKHITEFNLSNHHDRSFEKGPGLGSESKLQRILY